MTSVFDDPEKEMPDDEEIKVIIKKFTEAYRKERMERGISQMEVKEKENIAQKSISGIEAGNNFRMSNYIKICRAIGLTPVVKFKKYRRGDLHIVAGDAKSE